MFIGRQRELDTLNRLYTSDKFEFVVLYGRRRVGKTYLIDDVFRNRFTFRHAGLSPAETEKKGVLAKLSDAAGSAKEMIIEIAGSAMDKAKDLLTCTSMKTSEIGFEVGYRDPHYFSYIFKKTQGMSPKEYRRIKKES